ncbi:glycoside hydrolase family 15 protein [Luteococcus sediminum]
MSTHTPIEDYALLSDRRTAALVSRQGSIDWLCLPRFDDEAVFCAILGDRENGRWLMAPVDGEVVERRYRDDTFVLETRWRTPSGECLVTEFMPQANDRADLVRHVTCTSGTVTIEHELTLRFRYGQSLPWMRRAPDEQGEQALVAISGPNALVLHGPDLHPDDAHHAGRFELDSGESACWTLTWFESHLTPPAAPDVAAELDKTVGDWQKWADDILSDDHCREARRSLLVLRALTHHETGGIVAAPTTSLPEDFGGERNWDYRYVWLRDSALTMEVMLDHGLTEKSWRDWLLRAVASDHHDLQIMYGVGAERLGQEQELDHLAGHADSRPVRIGNGAAGQYQADVIGEVMLALQKMREHGIAEDRFSWTLQAVLLDETLERLDEPDHGIWEMRGDLHHFTHSRAMMWAAFDCGVRAVEQYGFKGNVEAWREARDRLHDEIWDQGFNTELNSFTQSYGSTEVDASLLVLPGTGLVSADDERMLGTVARIEQDLVDEDGFVHRYRTEAKLDGLEGDEHPFLLCTFWLVTQYARSGRLDEAQARFEKLVALGGELGLLAEEYDPATGRHAGNYPQAFSHLGLAQAAAALRKHDRR